MYKTVYVDAFNTKKGEWEIYEEPTGEMKNTLFGQKPATVKKKRWIELDEFNEQMIDGRRLATDIQNALNKLVVEKYEVMEITSVLSGRYNWEKYSNSGNGSASTCASWGYSVTEGVIITAKRSAVNPIS